MLKIFRNFMGHLDKGCKNMLNSHIMATHQIREDLKRFQEYKEKTPYVPMDLKQAANGAIYHGGDILVDEQGRHRPHGKTFINAGYTLSGSESKQLSNLARYDFPFRGVLVKSIEAVLQSLKFQHPYTQRLVWDYYGLEANHVKANADHNWKEDGILHIQGEPIKRDSSEYDRLVEEIYISAYQNPLYRNILLRIPADKRIVHSIGKQHKTQTVLTRLEFETNLNSLKGFTKQEMSK